MNKAFILSAAGVLMATQVMSSERELDLPAEITPEQLEILEASREAAVKFKDEWTAVFNKGYEALQNNKPEKALSIFQNLVEMNDRVGVSWLYLGHTLNLLERYEEAVIANSNSLKHGVQSSQAPIELARALYGSGRLKDALQQLDRYEAVEPGNAEVSYLRASILWEMRRGRKAHRLFEEAATRDPEYATLLESFLSDSVANTGIRASVNLGIGYNNNVLTLGEDVHKPEDVSHRYSSFGQFTASLSYSPYVDDSLVAGYQFDNAYYEDVDGFDSLDHLAYVRGGVIFTDQVKGTLGLRGQLSEVDADRYREIYAIRPSMRWQAHPSISVDVSYEYENHDYFTELADPELDRDAVKDNTTLNVAYQSLEHQFVTWAWIGQENSDAEGQEFQSDSLSYGIGMSMALMQKMSIFAMYEQIDEDFDNVSLYDSESAPREDEVGRLVLRLDCKITQSLNANLTYYRTDNKSSVAVFNYDQDIVSLGLGYTF